MKNLPPENVRSALRMDMLPPGGAGDIAVFDEGVHAFTDFELQRIADGATAGRHAICGASRNSICYKISAGKHGSDCAVLKQAVLSAGRTNPDRTFKREAANLKQLAGLEIPGCPVLLARFRSRGRYYLLLTFVPGGHPHPWHLPLQATALRQLFETFFRMDRAGFIHYDLQASNIVLSSERAGLIDFEFAGQTSPFVEQDDSYLCDYNISPNPHVPLRSCVCNFEFRTLYPYLAGLRSRATAQDVLAWVQTYLACKSTYHQRMAEFFESAAAAYAPRVRRIFKGGLRLQQLRCGAHYEAVLARMYRQPVPEIILTEYLVLKLRFRIFEQEFNGRDFDRASAIKHVRAKLCRLSRPDGGNIDDCARLYFAGTAELLDKLERKADRVAEKAAEGHC
jgi:predicted Ser/Thr protein kinase